MRPGTHRPAARYSPPAARVVAYRSHAYMTQSPTATSMDFNVPAGVQNGDLLLLAVTSDTTNTPAGWTLLKTQTRVRLFWRTANNEPAAYTVTVPAADYLGGGMVCFYATPAATINLDASAGSNNSSGTYTAPSVTVAKAGGAVCAFINGGLTLALDPPANYTERYDLGSWRFQLCMTRDNVAAGATGTLTASKTGGSDASNGGVSVAMSAA
jgi:hypothetical protein